MKKNNFNDINLSLFKNNKEDMEKYHKYKKIDLCFNFMRDFIFITNFIVFIVSVFMTILSFFSMFLYNYTKLEFLKDLALLYDPAMISTAFCMLVFTIFFVSIGLYRKFFYSPKIELMDNQYLNKEDFIGVIKKMDKKLLKGEHQDIPYEILYDNFIASDFCMPEDFLVYTESENFINITKKIDLLINKTFNLLGYCFKTICYIFFVLAISTLIMEIACFVNMDFPIRVIISILFYTIFLIIVNLFFIFFIISIHKSKV